MIFQLCVLVWLCLRGMTAEPHKIGYGLSQHRPKDEVESIFQEDVDPSRDRSSKTLFRGKHPYGTGYGGGYGGGYKAPLPPYYGPPPPGAIYKDPSKCHEPLPCSNAMEFCTTNIVTTCIYKCEEGYRFPNGQSKMVATCNNGKWTVDGITIQRMPNCQAICVGGCLNGGRCVSPDTCQCKEAFYGSSCQYEKKQCPPLPTPMNSRKTCSELSCTVTCHDGHHFPGGSITAGLACKDGRWLPSRKDWVSLPDCIASCSPECQNGGICLSYNVCQCPSEFRGPQCQYSVNVCKGQNLQFNGNYQCSGDDFTLNCSVSCPSGMRFEREPSKTYTCLYSTGTFRPEDIPACVSDLGPPEDLLEYLFSGSSSSSGAAETGRLEVPPKPGSCFAWGKGHYKTFDGKVISFKSDCAYTLVSDKDNSFSVETASVRPGCDVLADKTCYRLVFYIYDAMYTLAVGGDGSPNLEHKNETHRVPVQLPGLRTGNGKGDSVTLVLQPFAVNVVWDLMNTVEISVPEALWDKTRGLCGVLDGDPLKDFQEAHNSLKEYASLSRVDTVGEMCQENVIDENKCSAGARQSAQDLCGKIMNDRRFEACKKVLPLNDYYEACLWDFCDCEEGDDKCGCKTMELMVKECRAHGVELPPWRDESTCPMSCGGGQVLMACGKEATCGGPDKEGAVCEEGCFCPEGTFLHKGTCVAKEDCPCYLRGNTFPPGHVVPKECNTCKCVSGAWTCTSKDCPGRCEVVGDPHYTTFDKRRYDFMGKCSYFLVKTEAYSVEAENVPCEGSISQDMGFPKSALGAMPSCTKSVTVRAGEAVLKLKRGKEVTLNGEDALLPLSLKHLYVRHASSIFVQVELEGGVEVWWDGVARVYVQVPPKYKGKTMGLCGTFNGNQKDDFLTPEGDVEQDASAFADKWKTKDSCDSGVAVAQVEHPCVTNVQNKATAEKLCARITSQLFRDCHNIVSPDAYYENCLYDMCSCEAAISACLCPNIGDYARECAHQGVSVNWRLHVRECGLQCPRGQQFQTCGDSCVRSCQDLAREIPCTPHCEEGCNCPPGLTLDRGGQCVPIAQCPCLRNGVEYPPGHKEIRQGKGEKRLCTCTNAVWSCLSATSEDVAKYPNDTLELSMCKAEKNKVYTHCEPSDPVTCQNMHAPREERQSEAVCYGGCVCEAGYVLDSLSKECVKADECPCHHGARSYRDGQTIREECNTCVCNSGKWTCTEHVCPGVCTAWGDAHFKSFDGKIYDFQGTCEYVFSEGALSETERFSVVIEMVPCGSSGVSCSKSLTLSVGEAGSGENLVFSDNKAVPGKGKMERISVREAGLFLFADVEDLGIVVQWDRGTRLSLRADPKWKSKVKGLCGNYNGDANDDFATAGGGGVSEVSPHLFGESWKLYPYCPEAEPVQDTCQLRPRRKSWAVQKCGILKSATFKLCHTEVAVEPYLQRCIFDACGCDEGGDCECLCTAVSAYAQECNAHGAPVRWRARRLCPFQCDPTCTEYSPCVDTCPPETCESVLASNDSAKICSQDTCVEGCRLKPCPEGEIYNNLKELLCIPKHLCKPPCLRADGKDYNEGDLMEADDCHSCYCSRNKKVCKGQPCSTTPVEDASTPPLPTPSEEDDSTCVPGWTEWLNRHRPSSDSVGSDVETLPSLHEFGRYSGYSTARERSPKCRPDMMVDIKCRTVDSHESVAETGEDAGCDLVKGLQCRNGCHDYEISVFCNCDATTTVVSDTTEKRVETTHLTTTEAAEEVTQECSVVDPLKPHPEDCSLYYQCQDTGLGAKWVQRPCGPSTWYNPESMTCDFPEAVAAVRPECKAWEKASKKCTDMWSEWINTSSPDNGVGDIETFSEIKKAGIQLCKNNGYVKDIQCMYHKKKHAKTGYVKTNKVNAKLDMVDYTKSGDIVTCDTDIGLECLNGVQEHGSKCQDYSIRVYCACETKRTASVVEEGRVKGVPSCKPGYVQDSCAIQCNKLCHYYEGVALKNGTCKRGIPCAAGCRVESRTVCPPGHRWRDSNTCVSEQDCTCRSHNGDLVKPGTVVKETDCETCQCVDNEYVCDDRACATTPRVHITEAATRLPPETTGTTVIMPSTVTPPPHCDRSKFVPMLKDLPDSAFTASSSMEGIYEPQNARLSSPQGSWKPSVTDSDQYLQIDLGQPTAVYGITTKGNQDEVEFVGSFYVLYSTDNTSYSYVTFLNKPELFHGPNFMTESMTQVFPEPVEARYVRVNPVSWMNEIVMKVEVYGCGEGSTPPPTETTPYATTTTIPVCTDKMSADMQDRQVSASSSVGHRVTSALLSVYNNAGWTPQTSGLNEWIQFDFLGERTLTGMITMGGGLDVTPEEPAWVSGYAVKYSHDGLSWNTILDADGSEKLFTGNSNENKVHTSMFEMPVRARYLKLVPKTWHRRIALRLQAVGCYEPYPESTTEAEVLTTEPPAEECNTCPGATTPQSCPCSGQTFWDGDQCVTRPDCPCFVGFISYAVGTVFDNDACEVCTCFLGGSAHCKAVECPACGEGLQKYTGPTCKCDCRPCPHGEVLCHTSNVCIAQAFWCDGTMDCPDDEVNCTAPTTTERPTTRKPPIAATTKSPQEACPVIVCPEGFNSVQAAANDTSGLELQEEPSAPQWSPFGTKSKWSTYFGGAKGGRKGGAKGGPKSYKGQTSGAKKSLKSWGKPARLTQRAPGCPQYSCKPVVSRADKPCPKPDCKPGFDLVVTKGKQGDCDSYSCVAKKVKLPDGKCNVTGRTFNTFDGTEFKYEICDHVLARDKIHKRWDIKQIKKCSYVGPCLKYLLIRQGNHTIQFNPDLSILYDGYNYTVAQMQKIGAQTQGFGIKQVSNTFIIFSSEYDFSIIWDAQGNTKIIVPGSSRGSVDGLCGFFDGHQPNDKQKPSGELAATSQEFGDSWGESSQCETRVCPSHLQNKAWTMCKELKDGPLAKCSGVINLDKMLTQCVESICSCMEGSNDTDSCRCQAILDSVAECQARDPGLDLTQWRVAHDCHVSCPEGLVYKECLNRVCELSCADLLVPDVCPVTSECFPGCYCPDGLVKEGEKCLSPTDCRDCTCDSYGHSGYISFDRSDFIFGGNCTYVLSQTVKDYPGQKFKVLGTNGPCVEDPGEVCLHVITILHKEHTVQVMNDKNKRIVLKIDGTETSGLPVNLKWVQAREAPGKCLILNFPKLHLDLEFYKKGKGFYLRLPSHLYAGKTEGLCGSCNLNVTDDFKMRNGSIADDVEVFGQSWLEKDLPQVLGKEETCQKPERQVECLPPPPDQDPCFKLLDQHLFGKCHAVVDPSTYIGNCHLALCKESSSTCQFLEAYARECQAEHICLDWRSPDLCPYRCPAGLEYQSCGSGCTPTCENFQELRENPASCPAVPGDTCACARGKVLANGTCVEEKRCSPCDAEGHFPGDEWSPDPCTTCACSESSVQCRSVECADSGAVCRRGFKAVLMKATQDECCPKHVCVPEPTSELECEEPQQPECGHGQVIKLETTPSGCQEFICQCKPAEECDDTGAEMKAERPAGMKPSLDSTGCCPRVVVLCKPETCPDPPDCPQFHVPIKKETDKCCPEFICSVPEYKCLYEMQYGEGQNGGERPLKTSEKYQVLKDAGDVWNDGPCRTCACEDGNQQPSCTTKLCSLPPESKNYVYEPKHVNHKCCPIYKRKACKMGTNVYKAGETWTSPDGDPCKNYTCVVGSDGEISKREAVETCKRDCPLGWTYEDPSGLSLKCCGECKAVMCVVDSQLYPKGAVWASPDNCTSYQCRIEDNQVQVISSEEQCPNIADCPEERVYQDTCCKKCNTTIPESHSACTAENVPLDDTIHLVSVVSRDHGNCVNLEYIRGMTQCLGTCDSYTKFNKATAEFESVCQCCRASSFKTLSVPLDCDDGTTSQHDLRVPESCDCHRCDERPHKTKRPLTRY